MFRYLAIPIALIVLVFQNQNLSGEDWPRFRGTAGSGVAASSDSIPIAWSPKANVSWKVEMPGPGASSPIVVDGKVFVTCYSGYGLSQQNPGNIDDLIRHLVCIDLKSGQKLWQQDVPVKLPEDPYTGAGVPAHGYASHTPVSDGKNVYVFFGKGGVHAFDMDGNPQWQAHVGEESDPARWGSSSSPVVYGDTVIITASAESQAIVGLDKKTGEEIWRQEAKGLDNMWGTPTLVQIDDERTDLVMSVAKELWGLDPSNGKLRWYANATGAEHAYSSVVLNGKRIYAVTGRGGGSIALDAGGSGNISETNTVWTGRDSASFASPVLHGDKLYVVASGFVTVVDAKSGERIQRLRLRGAARTGGRFGSLDYPSPVVVGDHMYYMNGSGQMFVFHLGDEMELVSVNKVTSETETFWGSPAVSNNRMVLRSQKYVYCVTELGDKVNPEDNQAESVGVTDANEEEAASSGRGGRDGNRRFDPMAMFNRFDSNSDGQISESELEGNPMAERMKPLDDDGDGLISKDEFQKGMRAVFSRNSGRGSRGGRGAPTQNKPDRPQRPTSADGQ